MKHNFVVSYAYELPFDYLFGVANRWTKGWTISGITHFSSGFPVSLLNYGDNSLLGAEPNGINNARTLVPEDGGHRVLRVAGDEMPVRVADSGRRNLYAHFAIVGTCEIKRFDLNPRARGV